MNHKKKINKFNVVNKISSLQNTETTHTTHPKYTRDKSLGIFKLMHVVLKGM